MRVLALVFLPKLRGGMRLVAGCALVVLAAAIGFPRIALGAHYLSDVIAGYVLGAAWLAATIAVFNAWRADQR